MKPTYLNATEFWDLKHQIDDEVARLDWNKDECIAYIQKHYNKRSRLVMTDEQLYHLLSALKAIQPGELTQNLLTPQARSRRRKRR